MKIAQIIKKTMKMITYAIVAYCLFSPELSHAGNTLTAEYKCTSKCTLCITYPQKTVCSSKYNEDSEDYMKAKKLSKFVNDGLIIPDDKLKPNFDLNLFASKYFNCELMIKKADQIREATQNMCMTKTVNVKKTMLVPRMPASVVPPKKSNGKIPMPPPAEEEVE